MSGWDIFRTLSKEKYKSKYAFLSVIPVSTERMKELKKAGISDIPDLISQMGKKNPKEIEKLLKKILTKKDGTRDARAYNSVILYLYRHGNSNLPPCKKIKP